MSVEKKETLIQVQNLTKTFGGSVHALNGVSTDIKKGEVVCVIGPSGSGKSTFLRCLNRLEDPTDGRIIFAGEDLMDPKTDIDMHRQKMGMVFQHFNLFPHMSILKNMTIAPMKLQKRGKDEAEGQAMKLLERVGLADRANAYPSQLSGGMRQRAAFARTVLTGSDLLLLDEPFSALDYLTRISMREWLLEQWEREKKTVLFITHDVEEAVFLSSRILVVEESPITHLRSIDVPAEYPRSRDELRKPEILSLKEELIGMLRKETS